MMRTIFGLFDTYNQAKEATEKLVDNGFKERDVGAIAQERTVKNYLSVRQDKVDAAASDKLNGKDAPALDRILGTQDPISTRDADSIYAAGDEATLVVKSFGTQTEADGPSEHAGLERALTDIKVPQDVASAYVEGIENGGVLLIVRADDDKAAQASSVLSEHHGKHVAGYMR